MTPRRKYSAAALALACFLLTSPASLLASMFYHTRQGSVMSPLCPLGSKEAEEIYQRARYYRSGQGDYPVDKFKAKELFKQAVRMGNSKAAIALGQMFQYDFYANAPEKDRFKFMITMYELSAEMGCPDAYVFLAEDYNKGWGVKRDPEKARKLLKKAAEQGSPKGLEFYGIEVSADPRAPGMVITSDPKLRNEGRKYLERSMQLGNGDAGAVLFYLYKREENIELMIKSLRQGAKFGSKASLYQLQRIYFKGQYGQYQDKEYAACFKRLEEAIDDFDSPKPISNFDQICPPRPIQLYLDSRGE